MCLKRSNTKVDTKQTHAPPSSLFVWTRKRKERKKDKQYSAKRQSVVCASFFFLPNLGNQEAQVENERRVSLRLSLKNEKREKERLLIEKHY